VVEVRDVEIELLQVPSAVCGQGFPVLS